MNPIERAAAKSEAINADLDRLAQRITHVAGPYECPFCHAEEMYKVKIHGKSYHYHCNRCS